MSKKNYLKEICDTRGLRMTEPRVRVFEKLTHAGKPMTAYEIVAALDDLLPMTVYRVLDFLTENGLAHRIEALNAYAACEEHHCDHTDSLYLVCTSCDSVTELHDHKIGDTLTVAAHKKGFALRQTRATLHGQCKDCS